MLTPSTTSTLWVRSDYKAAYPNLEAASKALIRDDRDTLNLTRVEVPERDLSKWKGVLANSEGRIERSGPKRLLDALAGTASTLGSGAAFLVGVACGATIIGAFYGGPSWFAISGDLAETGVDQISRAVTGGSDRATSFARDRVRDLAPDHQQRARLEYVPAQGEEGERVRARVGEEPAWILR